MSASLDEETICEGQWWVPGFEDQKLLGELVRSRKNRIELRFKIAEGFKSGVQQPLKVVHGLDEHGKPVSLFYAMWAGSSQTSALTKFAYNVGYYFHGLHLKSWADAVFDELESELPHLTSWVAISGFLESDKTNPEAKIRYKLPPDRAFDCGKGFKLVLAARMRSNSSIEGTRSIEEIWFLRLVYSKSQPFKRIRRDYQVIRRLLSLATGESLREEPFVLRRKIDSEWFGGKRLPYDVHCIAPGARRSDAKAYLPPFEMRFSFTKVEQVFEKILKNWMTLQVRLEDVLNLFFSTEENAGLYSHHRFLILAQALEVYHRCWGERYSQFVETPIEFASRSKRILALLAKSDAKWLKQKIGGMNRVTLDMRIRAVLADKRKWIAGLVPDEKDFSESVRVLRNQYTHWPNHTERKRRDKPLDTSAISERLFQVLLVCILSDLGLPDEIILNAVKHEEGISVSYTEEDEKEQGANSFPMLLPPIPKRQKRR